MKVLVVCHANVGRSQVAQVCFERISKNDSLCAGMGVDEQAADRPSKKMKDIANPRPVEFIKTEFGVDVSERDRLQLTPRMIEDANLAIIIHEKQAWPDYLQEGGKVVFWDIPDTGDFDDDGAYEIWKQVQRRVEELVREIG